MSTIARCPHCSARQRILPGPTRQQCSYCTGLLELEAPAAREEWVGPAELSASAARASALRWISEMGLHGTRLRVESGRFLCFWQVVSEGGEEYFCCADPEASSLERNLRLPALPLIPRGEFLENVALELVPPVLGEQEVLAAARAGFAAEAQEARTVRLIWIPTIPLVLELASEIVEGLYIPGADKVYFAPLPERAQLLPPRRSLLRAYAIFCAVSLIFGALAPGKTSLLLGQALLLGLGLVLFGAGPDWRLRRRNA